MAEDLESFRKLAKKVYETMTQDVSDVLINEQLQMVQYYEEKSSLLSEKMMRAINQIYEMAPDFDFEKYLKDKDDYLLSILPLPREAEMMSDEAFEMVRRQQAYHRLQWLRSEGERMSEENKRLVRRLEELKMEQQLEQERAADLAVEAEEERKRLALEENEMKDKLEKLNQSIDKSFIRDELNMTQQHNLEARQPTSEADVTTGRSTGAIRKTRSGAGIRKPSRQKPQWASSTAAEIEDEAANTTVATETTKTASKTGLKRPKTRSAKTPQRRPEQQKERSPFHFSPVKTPPPAGEDMGAPPPQEEFVSFGKKRAPKAKKQASPFHYSPPKSPTMGEAAAARREPAPPPEEAFGAFGRSRPPPQKKETSPFHYSPPKSSPPERPKLQETRIEQATTTVHQKRPRGAAPKDTWGGFW